MDFNFLKEQVPTGESANYLDWLIQGSTTTVVVSVSAFFMALLIGILVGSLRTTKGKAQCVATGYFEIVRSIPFIALLFINYYVVPVVFFPELVKTADPNTMVYMTGIVSLAIFMSSRISAQVYAGIKALPAGQFQSAKALGFSTFQSYTRFFIPQALRNIVPTLTSEAMNTVKNSAVVSAIGLVDLSLQAQSIIEYTAKPIEAFICIALGYLLINGVVLVIMKTIERATKRALPDPV
ncbi:amino acid ABC transporter permease [Diaphorobacter aerolatus]|uniref:Amino acid ABC transporter permease n=1 Tax=Diaphorobacter aerolatus TaxID=1288495 RepID=A0A7H0GJ93_9BURK|nr:amino acid ABC transporter permease [Diaphorobacter aerolatus]QNP48359.1 amino acid ABC transporter permease [Diaphorobacter aerolatus]